MTGNTFSPDTTTSGHAVQRCLNAAAGTSMDYPYNSGLQVGYTANADPLLNPLAHKAEGWNAILQAKGALALAIGATANKISELAEQEEKFAGILEAGGVDLPGVEAKNQTLFALQVLRSNTPYDQVLGGQNSHTMVRPLPLSSDLLDLAPTIFDSTIVLNRALADAGIEPLDASSDISDPQGVLQRYKDLKDIITILGEEGLSTKDKEIVARARRIIEQGEQQ
jgi:hypothetical protein